MKSCLCRAAAAFVAAASLLVLASPSAHAAEARAYSFPRLSYYGGRVLTNVKVDVVVWGSWGYGSTVPLTGARSIAGFFGAVTASPYVDWLSEYDTPTQHIGRGRLDGVFTISPGAYDGAVVTQAQIANVLRWMIATGHLPRPDANRVYALFFRPGQTVTNGNGDSVHNFCAYHDTMTYGSTYAYFAVIPYELGNAGCRHATTSFDNVTTVVSHELVETITDPGIGLLRLSWYDRANGEIGDICARTFPGWVTGGDGRRYVVQREWSTRARGCIVTR